MQNPATLNLIAWFKQHARRLPWRQNPSVYKTVVSEFMLQQTQIKTMLPYFERWMQEFPSFQALAQAPLTSVLAVWSGLGYYTRAKHLHAFAQTFIHRPVTTYAELLTYPGIGPYTAAAIASIAFNEPVMTIDGNVIRVLARLLNHSEVFTSQATARTWVQPYLQRYFDKTHPGVFNEALMECGATICTKTHPVCPQCPLRVDCQAFQLHTQSACPQFLKAKELQKYKHRLWHLNANALLLAPSTIATRTSVTLLELPELSPEQRTQLPELQPIFTGKRRIGNTTYTETLYSLPPSVALPTKLIHQWKAQWLPIKALNQYPLSGPHKRWIQAILTSLS